jgi:hypothetical protein
MQHYLHLSTIVLKSKFRNRFAKKCLTKIIPYDIIYITSKEQGEGITQTNK